MKMEGKTLEEEKNYGEPISQSEDFSENDVQTEAISPTDGDVTESSVFPEQNVPSESESANEAELEQEENKSKCAQEAETEVPLEPLKEIDLKLAGITDMERRISSEVKEMHKLYHTEFAGRLKSMQDELEQYRKIDKGRAYDDILGALARIYGNNETLADEVDDPKAKKNIRYMLLDIEDLLGVYGMSKLRSSPGEKRNPRHCQILNRIHTDDPEKHDTVAKSYNSGFYIGNRTVIKELVDIYFFDGQSIILDTENKTTNEAVDTSVSE